MCVCVCVCVCVSVYDGQELAAGLGAPCDQRCVSPSWGRSLAPWGGTGGQRSLPREVRCVHAVQSVRRPMCVLFCLLVL